MACDFKLVIYSINIVDKHVECNGYLSPRDGYELDAVRDDFVHPFQVLQDGFRHRDFDARGARLSRSYDCISTGLGWCDLEARPCGNIGRTRGFRVCRDPGWHRSWTVWF